MHESFWKSFIFAAELVFFFFFASDDSYVSVNVRS